MSTRVVHCQREPYDVYIGRPSPWGNPFAIGPDGTREEVIARYEQYLLASPQLLAALPQLAGRVLGCWCAPQPCHGDVLARYADSLPAPAGQRVTCWWYVLNRGLADRYGTMDWLLEIGQRAASEARWQGIEEWKVIEGPAPGPNGLEWIWAHTWPEQIWAATIAAIEQEQSSIEWALSELAAGHQRWVTMTDAAAEEIRGPSPGIAAAAGNYPSGHITGAYDPNEDVTAYPGPNGEQAGYDIGY